MRNTFNKLLIALSCFDMALLLHAVLWGATMGNTCTNIILDLNNSENGTHTEGAPPVGRKQNSHDLLFSSFLHPLKYFSMTGSILMLLAIATERFRVVYIYVYIRMVYIYIHNILQN